METSGLGELITQGPRSEGIYEYNLHSGLKILLIPDPTATLTRVSMTYFVGSRHDGHGKSGLAHIVEHIVSCGAARHKDARAEQRERGASHNARTSFDYTTYYEQFPYSESNLAWALDLEADRMSDALFQEEVFVSQLGVILSECHSTGNSTQSILLRRMLEECYSTHGYGNSPVGVESEIKHITLHQARKFYRAYYRQDNAILIISGMLDEGTALAMIGVAFQHSAGPRAVPLLDSPEDVIRGEGGPIIVTAAGSSNWIGSMYRLPAATYPESSLISITVRALTSLPSGRLQTVLRSSGISGGVSGQTRFLRISGYAVFMARVEKHRSCEAATNALTKGIEEVYRRRLSFEEIARAKAELLQEIDFDLAETTRCASMLSKWAALGDWRLYFVHRDTIRTASTEAIRKASASYLRTANRTIGEFIPSWQSLPTAIPRALTGAPMVERERGPEGVQTRATRARSGGVEGWMSRATLSNGLHLAVCSKDTYRDSVIGMLKLRFGDARFLRERSAEGMVAADMLLRGSETLDAQQICDTLTELRACVSVSDCGSGVLITIETYSEHIVDIIRVLASVIRAPIFPEGEFDSARSRLIAGRQTVSQTGDKVAEAALDKILCRCSEAYLSNVLTQDDQIARIKELTLHGVREFYHSVYGASDGQFVFVGPVQFEQLRSAAEDAFGTWHSPRRYVPVNFACKIGNPVREVLRLPQLRRAAGVAIGTLLDLDDEDVDFPALNIANRILGGWCLRARGNGLAYYVGSHLTASNGFSKWAARGSTIQENVGRLETVLEEGINKASVDGFDAAEVIMAKQGWVASRTMARATTHGLARHILQNAETGRTMGFEADLDERVSLLTSDRVTEVCRKHLVSSRLSSVVVCGR